MAEQGYAHPEFLVETEWLAEHLKHPGIRIVDGDLPDAYNRAHIPGAVNTGENHWLKGEDGVHVMEPKVVAEFLGALGIGDDTLVIAYDGHEGMYAARLWWMLNYYGHPKVKVLNGGWRKWLAESRPVTDTTTSSAPATFTPRQDPAYIVSGGELKSVVSDVDTVIWDVRRREEYTGELVRRRGRANKHEGHIPGAKQMEWTDVIDTAGLSTFKPAAQLRQMLQERGITSDKQVYTH